MRVSTVTMVAVVLLGIGSDAQSAPAEIHCKHFIHGYPTGAPASSDLIIRDVYALSSNDETKFADWVCYQLTPHETFGSLDLEREWRNDPFLDGSETLEAKPEAKDDYKGAHATAQYDRGHLAALASFKGSRFASQVNFYSNIVPQKSAMNQGLWGDLENRERDLVRRYGTNWVMVGPLYESDMDPLPNADEMHKVPSAFWKIFVVQDAGVLRVAAFIMNQNIDPGLKLVDTLTTVDEVEKRTGLDFLRELPDAQENAIESDRSIAWVTTWAE